MSKVCVLVLVLLLDSTHALHRVPGIELIGQGYNILNANPDLLGVDEEPTDGMVDPGLTGKSVFKLSYNTGREDLFGRFETADQATFVTKNGCEPDVHVIYNSENTYRDRLMSKYLTSGFEGFQDVAFTLGMAFHEPHHKIYHQVEHTCRLGQASYDLLLPDPEAHTLDPEFVEEICGLQNDTESAYFNVIDKFGTHIVTKAEIGYRTFNRRVVELADFMLTIGTLPSGAYVYDLGVPLIHLSVFSNELIPYVDKIFGSTGRTWSVGTSLQPTGTAHELLRLSSLIDSHSMPWSRVCSNSTNEVCCSALSSIRSKMDTALRAYAAHKNIFAEPDESHISLPLQWPLGTYGLPNTDLGCAGSTSIWTAGKVVQFTNGVWRNYNKASEYNHFPQLAVAHTSVRQHFCMKASTVSSGMFHWERGSYCIYKKNECPKGFMDGSIYFDDNNDENWKTGSVPDGSYGVSSTEIEFCCRSDGSPLESIILPSLHPFYLIRSGGVCQAVHNMKVTLDSIEFSRPYWYPASNIEVGYTPDTRIETAFVKLYYCYYEPVNRTPLKFVLKTLQSN